jgi:ABC-2 type transport system ATP-binding protein
MLAQRRISAKIMLAPGVPKPQPPHQRFRCRCQPRPVIQVEHLTKRYGEKVAVQDLSFAVRPGIVTGFLGPNGAGKSTTMRVILGLDRPTAGSAVVNGRRYRELSAPLHEVGAMLEARAIHTGRSAYHHLLAMAQTHGIGRSRVQEMIELVGLADVARKRAGGFSLGMGQRLGIAAALLGDPATLILDEPSNGLDPEGILWIRTLLKRLAAEGRTVFLSSHLMAEISLTAEHLIVIGRGRLIADASVSEILSKASEGGVVLVRTPQAQELRNALVVAKATVQSPEPGRLEVQGLSSAEVGGVAAREGIVLHELVPQQASLEDAFMRLTGDALEYHALLEGPSEQAGEVAA